MQIRQSNFFTTQIPSSQRYTISKDENNLSLDLKQTKKNPSIRIRQAKSEAKKVTTLYNQTLQQFLRVKNSIQKNNSKTHKLREEFIKLYGNKKLKYTNKSMMETKKHMDEQFKQETCNKVRTMKLSNDLGIMYTKNQCEALNNRVRDQNRKFADDLKKQLRVRRKQELDEAKQKFHQVKRGQTQFLIRKKNMSAIVSTRAYHNYLLKVNKQMEMLESYTKLLDKFNDLPDINIINKADVDQFNKTFFVTTKNSFS